MRRTIGVEEARARLGRLADEVAEEDEPVVLTRRGHAVAVLVSAAEYERLVRSRRRLARAELQVRLDDIRQRVAAAGLDTSAVDEAIAAAARFAGEDTVAQTDPASFDAAIDRLAGSWSAEDSEAAIEYIYRAREEGTRPATRP